MRFFNVLIFILFINFSFSQTYELKKIKEKIEAVSKTKREYFVIDNGMDVKHGVFIKHGSYKEFYKKHEIVKGQYKLDKKEGYWVYKDPEGDYLQEGSFHKGKKVGVWNSHLKGKLDTKAIYNQNGRLDSLYSYYAKKDLIEYYYYDSIKKLSFKRNIIGSWYKREEVKTDSNKLSVKVFYPNGKLVQEKKFENDKLVYVSDVYDTIGKVLIPSTINKGNGILKTIYLDKLLKGKTITQSTIEYIDGTPNGLFQKFNIKGKLIVEGNYLQGKKQGTWKTWSNQTKSYKNQIIDDSNKDDYKLSNIVFYNNHSRKFSSSCMSLIKNRKKKCEAISKQELSRMVNKSIVENFYTYKISKGAKSGKYKIKVIFKIDDLGEISDIKVTSPFKSKLVKDQVEKALNNMPTLIPASNNSKFVKYLLFSLPISFTVN